MMYFVKFNMYVASACGCDDSAVFAFSAKTVEKEDGTLNEDYLDDFGFELARENYESYFEDVEDEEDFSSSWEVLEGTEEEIEEDYGEIDYGCYDD